MERMSRAVHKINEARYRRLLSRTMPVVIETEEENERMLAVIEKLMDKGENVSPEEDKLLKLLVKLVEDFEKRRKTADIRLHALHINGLVFDPAMIDKFASVARLVESKVLFDKEHRTGCPGESQR